MDAKVYMILLFTLFITANASSSMGWNKKTSFGFELYSKPGSLYNCDGKIGDCIAEEEEMMLDSEASKQILALEHKFTGSKFIDKEHVPCSQPGQSYYTCKRRL
ncbi:hypothetical protein DCAR_0209078 [Daucus carota subsp. sativus]|uniref:Rapid ALkalinization Factor n=1 Tax=Daucus carota subsp. sativus TaxID=79200 RepID=A0A166F0G1_DAUCS|nr:hypothetical protein DCAR_0209078 [Daucus carota subsp. sativus]